MPEGGLAAGCGGSGEVGEGTFKDLAVVAIGLAQEDGGQGQGPMWRHGSVGLWFRISNAAARFTSTTAIGRPTRSQNVWSARKPSPSTA